MDELLSTQTGWLCGRMTAPPYKASHPDTDRLTNWSGWAAAPPPDRDRLNRWNPAQWRAPTALEEARTGCEPGAKEGAQTTRGRHVT